MGKYDNGNSIEWACGILFVLSLVMVFSLAWAVH